MNWTQRANETPCAFILITPLLTNSRIATLQPTSEPSKFLCSAKPSPTSQFPLSRRAFLALSAAFVLQITSSSPSFAFTPDVKSVYDIVVVKNGLPCPLNDYRGRLTLFVNVASYCALTPQYAGLVSLYDDFKIRGFAVIASPCDQFGHQEPGSNDEVCRFAREKFGARFLLLDKLNVNEGPGGVAPLYRFLRYTSPEGTGQRVSWNFEKFLVAPNGQVLRRYKPGVQPEDLRTDILWALDHPDVNLPPKKKPSLGVA